MKDNRLIAEFMQPSFNGFGTYDFDGCFFTIEELEFHSSWDWLMAVVEKIESLGHGVTIYRKGCHINNEIGFNTNGFNHSSKIEQTYKAVVEFIKWYNDEN